MNRIILIGNGFDLAHNLPTSFANFIDNYWGKIILQIKKSLSGEAFHNEDLYIEKCPIEWTEEMNYSGFLKTFEKFTGKIIFKNKLLRKISNRSVDNWVDIENEYYLCLKKSFQNQNSDYSIADLNRDFERIKKALENYISDIENNFQLNDDRLKNQIGHKIYSSFEYQDFTEKALNERAEFESELVTSHIKQLKDDKIGYAQLSNSQQTLANRLMNNDETEFYSQIRKILLNGNASNYFDLYPENILFLNFNYTKTSKNYSNSFEFGNFENIRIPTNTIHIHGTVYTQEKNPIIFGFGDEIDNDYKAIENLNDNRYLEHIKSIKYLEADNYKKLLEFVNKEEYQIFIFGHSCGISDRTLLNTIFENDNCVSIKPFYHKKTEYSDNFSELVMNITRNFNNKSSLRDKVVNKTYCEQLFLQNASQPTSVTSK